MTALKATGTPVAGTIAIQRTTLTSLVGGSFEYLVVTASGPPEIHVYEVGPGAHEVGPGAATVATENTAARMDAMAALNGLRGLPAEWNEDGAAPPNELAISLATLILDELHQQGLSPSRILPCADEGVTLCLVRNGRYAEIVCSNGGEIVSLRSDRKGERFVEMLSDSDIPHGVRRIADYVG